MQNANEPQSTSQRTWRPEHTTTEHSCCSTKNLALPQMCKNPLSGQLWLNATSGLAKLFQQQSEQFKSSDSTITLATFFVKQSNSKPLQTERATNRECFRRESTC